MGGWVGELTSAGSGPLLALGAAEEEEEEEEEEEVVGIGSLRSASSMCSKSQAVAGSTPVLLTARRARVQALAEKPMDSICIEGGWVGGWMGGLNEVV